MRPAVATHAASRGAAILGLDFVHFWYGGHSIGLYRVIQVESRTMLLKHGAISFPVGTLLDIVDFQRLVPHSAFPRLNTTVVDNTCNGIRLAW